MFRTIEEKFSTVIQKNTFYFFDAEYQSDYEGYINSIKETLLIVKSKVEQNGLKKEIFDWLLKEKKNGLRSLLALTGISNEFFKRLITLVRIVNDSELTDLLYKEKWCDTELIDNTGEWGDSRIEMLVRNNEFFRKGIINLFFEGASIPFLVNTLPLFELKKLSLSKLRFDANEMIDTLVRYKERGSYAGKASNNPEKIIKSILENLEITYEVGDLSELINEAPDKKRTMDFIIPNKLHPQIIIESSFLTTTSSGQGDKSKTEIAIHSLLKNYYPKAKFIGFVDGIGWYVRKGDLKRMVSAYEEVFTFHIDELDRFQKFLEENLIND